MPVGFQKLGWQWPRPNDFTDPNERPLRDTFNHLQRHLTFPYVGLRFDGAHTLPAAIAFVPMTVFSAAAAPFVAGDPYQLYRGAGTGQIQVPRDFDTWLAVGAAGFLTDGTPAAGSTATLGWRINSVTDVWVTQATRSVAGGVREVVPIMTPMRKGQTLEVAGAHTSGTVTLTDAEAWVVFLPLA